MVNLIDLCEGLCSKYKSHGYSIKPGDIQVLFTSLKNNFNKQRKANKLPPLNDEQIGELLDGFSKLKYEKLKEYIGTFRDSDKYYLVSEYEAYRDVARYYEMNIVDGLALVMNLSKIINGQRNKKKPPLPRLPQKRLNSLIKDYIIPLYKNKDDLEREVEKLKEWSGNLTEIVLRAE